MLWRDWVVTATQINIPGMHTKLFSDLWIDTTMEKAIWQLTIGVKLLL